MILRQTIIFAGWSIGVYIIFSLVEIITAYRFVVVLSPPSGPPALTHRINRYHFISLFALAYPLRSPINSSRL